VIRAGWGASGVIAAAVSCACVTALHEPPTVVELAGEATHQEAEVDRLLAAAEEAYARWTLESVRQASSTWLEAAAADPSRLTAWLGASRAGVWLAGHEPDAAAREAAAVSAVQSAQLCGERAPDDPACAYRLALALGVQARERPATALDALPRMVTLLERAATERPEMDHAGPHRVLALVLVRAPGWPLGPGDADRALEHARHAVNLEPDFPPSQMGLAEASAAVGKTEESRKAWERAEILARAWRDAGEPEAREWLDEIEATKKNAPAK
jgi:hypothetical protein